MGAVLCLAVLPSAALGQDLRGRWKITTAAVPSYVGAAMVDGDHRALFVDDLGPRWRGYVAHADSTKAEFVITDGAVVSRVFCVVQSINLLHCRILRPTGAISGPSVMARVGAAPGTTLALSPPK